MTTPDRTHIISARSQQHSSKQVLFLCLARDCGATIPAFFSYLAALRDAGLNCSAIIGENGSRDDTRALIRRFGGRGTELVDTGFMSTASSRLSRMAIGREAMLTKARERNVNGYVIVADLDNVMARPPAPPAVVGAIDRLRKDDTLFAVGATSSPVYYDLLALRTDEEDFGQLNSEILAARQSPLSYYKFHKDRIYARQRQLTRRVPLLCSSSFNGFCIYRAEDYLRSTYRSEDEHNVCEHVTFNTILARTGRRVLISSELVVQTPGDHAPVSMLSFWFNRLSKYVNKYLRVVSGTIA